MNKDKINQLWKSFLIKIKEANWEKISSYASMICGIAAYVLFMFWYVGLILSVVAIASGALHIKFFGNDKRSRVGIWCGAIFIGFALLVLMMINGYYSMIGLERS